MLLTLLLACGDRDDTGEAVEVVDPLSWSVQEAGPMSVGYRLVEHTYTDPAGQTVTLPVNLWYPTAATSGEAPWYFGLVEDPEAILDAAPGEPAHSGGFPVLIFSHGSFLYGGSSSFLMRHFASHGWVVAAPDHVGNLLTDYGDIPLPVYYHRPLNDAASIAAIEAQPDLAAADTARIILAGYSFGGFDTWAAAGGQLSRQTFADQCDSGALTDCTEAELDALEASFADSRIAGIIPMAGAGRFEYFTDDGLAGLGADAMQMSGTEDHDDPQRMWEATMGSSVIWVSIEGGCHEMFSVGGCPDLDREAGYSLIESYALAFARSRLLGDDGAEVRGLLEGTALPWSSVSVQIR